MELKFLDTFCFFSFYITEQGSLEGVRYKCQKEVGLIFFFYGNKVGLRSSNLFLTKKKKNLVI